MSNDLERLLQEQEYIRNGRREEYEVLQGNEVNTPILKADKSATLFDFITMIDKLVTLTMKNVKFIPDEKTLKDLDVMNNIDKPIITYKVIERVPKLEIKPRLRESFNEKDTKTGEDSLGEVYAQKFACQIQFDIFASVYSEAEQVMNDFEELMFAYTGFFKKNGVAEMYFKKHLTDTAFENLRENLSVRSLQYYVEIEKITVIIREKIKEIEILAQKKDLIKKEEN